MYISLFSTIVAAAEILPEGKSFEFLFSESFSQILL
jgi:hypothetical protein